MWTTCNCRRPPRNQLFRTQTPDESTIMAKKNSSNNRTPKNGSMVPAAKNRNGVSGGVFETVTRLASGLENENVSLDAITSEANELTSSLKQTATQAASVAASSEETASSINEISASVEQMTANIAQVASSSTQT